MSDWVVSPYAKEVLVGLTIKTISEDYPHSCFIEFTDGTVMTITGMPFSDGTLDIDVVESVDTFIETLEKP